MPTRFLMTRDVAGFNGFGLVPSSDGFSGLLATDTAQTINVPTDYKLYIAVFSYTPGANVFVDFSGATAVTPSGAIAASTVRLLPSGRQVEGGSSMSVITPDANGSYLTVEFYALENNR